MTDSERNKRFDIIKYQLMEFSECFYELGKIGDPIWDDSIPTAQIEFTRDGRRLAFRWSTIDFDKHDDYTIMATLCHEMCHIILQHGKRGLKLTDHRKANIMMDVYVNHLMVDGFGMNRSLINNWKDWCWRDTVFNINIEHKPSFEYYYNIEDEFIVPGFSTRDGHSFLIAPDSEIKDAIEDAATVFFDALPSGYGDEAKEICSDFETKKSIKRKFEHLVKGLVSSIKEKDESLFESWGQLDRRLCDFTTDIPGSIIIDSHIAPRKYRCYFYVDNSGSCANWAKKFCNVSASLDEKLFEVKLFSFDTKVYEVEKQNNLYRLYGGGGTSFEVVVNHLQSQEEKADIVIVLTDGFGEQVFPKNKKIWNWLLTECGTASSLDRAGNIYRLSQYE